MSAYNRDMLPCCLLAVALVFLVGCAAENRGPIKATAPPPAGDTAVWPVKHVTVSIDRPADRVYAYCVNPANLPQWAAGLSTGIEQTGGEWIADSPMGKVKVKFAPANPYGVLDHDVTLPDGQVVYNPMRVVPNGRGCQVTFTLFRRPGMTDQQFRDDAAAVERDLRTLKTVLEGQ